MSKISQIFYVDYYSSPAKPPLARRIGLETPPLMQPTPASISIYHPGAFRSTLSYLVSFNTSSLNNRPHFTLKRVSSINNDPNPRAALAPPFSPPPPAPLPPPQPAASDEEDDQPLLPRFTGRNRCRKGDANSPACAVADPAAPASPTGSPPDTLPLLHLPPPFDDEALELRW